MKWLDFEEVPKEEANRWLEETFPNWFLTDEERSERFWKFFRDTFKV